MKALFTTIGVLFGLAGAAEACPDYNQWGESYRASGVQLRQGAQFSVQAGGDNYIWNCPNVRPGTDQGAGYFTTAPDFTFELAGMSGLRLEISVLSNCDAALLINTGSANWYYDDDDNGNADPRISLSQPSDGYLDVWVGTYDGAVCDAVLYLETFKR